MELRRGKSRRGGVVALLLCCAYCLLLFSICSLFSSACNGNACVPRKESRSTSTDSHDQRIIRRRQLHGGVLGSYPPRCTSKCGHCTPCSPVHVPVPPGNPVTTEYYPEAWRCKCGNKLYMP